MFEVFNVRECHSNKLSMVVIADIIINICIFDGAQTVAAQVFTFTLL